MVVIPVTRHTIRTSVPLVVDHPLPVLRGQLQKPGRVGLYVNRLRQRNQWRSCNSAAQSVIDIDVAGLMPALPTDSYASSCIEQPACDKGDSRDVIREMSGRLPSDLGDAANRGYRSTVSTSKNPIGPESVTAVPMIDEIPLLTSEG